MTATPSPSPTPTEDATIERERIRKQKEKERLEKEKKDQAKKDKDKVSKTKLVDELLNTELNSDTDYSTPDRFNGNTETNNFETTLKQLQDDQKTILAYEKYNKTENLKGPGGRMLPSKVKVQARFEKNKQILLTFSRQWEKKNKKSLLDTLSTVSSDKANSQFLYSIMSDNPDKVQKFITPKIFKAETVLPSKGSFETTPITTEGAPVAPDIEVTKKPIIESSTGYGTNGTFIRGQDANGNVYYNWDLNEDKAMPVVLLGDNNGSMMRTQYGTPFSQATKDANGNSTNNLDTNSPMTSNEAFNRIVRQLENTPDGIKKFKQMVIAKHIVPPSAVNATMADPNTIDGTTTNAILYLINAATNHNVALHDMGKPNQKFMSFNDYLTNMPALSVSSTETSRVHQQIQPKDYELSIDQMFQNILGRGATEDELKHFTNQLQTYSNANPQVTTKTTTETTTGSSATANVSGGLSEAAAAGMMRDEALKNPEAEAFNKGSKYFDWFQEAIGSPVQLGG